MSKAEICPVCKGEGRFAYKGQGVTYEDCKGCDGKGWVEVGEPKTEWSPIQVWGWTKLAQYPPWMTSTGSTSEEP